MHIFGISVVLAYSALLIASEFIHELGQDYDDHEQDHGFPTVRMPSNLSLSPQHLHFRKNTLVHHFQ